MQKLGRLIWKCAGWFESENRRQLDQAESNSNYVGRKKAWICMVSAKSETEKKKKTWVSKAKRKNRQRTNVSWRAKRKAAGITVVLDSTNQDNYKTTEFQGAVNLLQKQVTEAEMVSYQREEDTVDHCCQSNTEAMTSRHFSRRAMCGGKID